MTSRNISRYAAQNHSFDSVESFLSSPVQVGLNTIKYNGYPMDVLIDPTVGAISTLVSFHPAVTNPKVTRPYFLGVQLFQSIPANRIYFSDPSLELDDDLTLGWFAGNQHQRDMQDVVATILQYILEGLSSKHTIITGASGGGFASLYYSARIDGSLALVVNPQTEILRYVEYLVQRYTRKAWGVYTMEKVRQVLHQRTTLGVVDTYAHQTSNSVIYLQNVTDRHHVENHFAPFLATLHPENCVGVVLGADWGEGHKPAPKDLQLDILTRATRANGDWSKLMLDIPRLVLAKSLEMNEFLEKD